MGKFLHAYDLPKLNQEDINHLHKFITSNETDAVIVSQLKKIQDQMDSLLNSTRPTKNLTSVLLKLFQKCKGKEHYQTHSLKPGLP
jgi:hypothetical protein